LGLGALWLLRLGARAARKRFEPRDLVPLAYAFSGITYYFAFKWSAVVHSYWAWSSLPFFAIACADLITGLVRWARARGRGSATATSPTSGGGWLPVVAILASAGLLAPLASRHLHVVPKARHAGGSMWFVAPIRGPVASYDSARASLRFAKWVRARTRRTTGVRVAAGFEDFLPEHRWYVTLDRMTRKAPRVPRRAPFTDAAPDGWVSVGLVGDLSFEESAELAARHPYRQYGRFYMVDHRREEVDVEVWDLMPGEMTLGHWLLVSPYEPPLRAERFAAAEARLRQAAVARAR
jgi:hypothetical protein